MKVHVYKKVRGQSWASSLGALAHSFEKGFLIGVGLINLEMLALVQRVQQWDYKCTTFLCGFLGPNSGPYNCEASTVLTKLSP